jgi:hypothetical protein
VAYLVSISRFQEKFLSGGCAKFVVGLMAAAFVGSLLYMGAGGSNKNEGEETAGTIAATVGNVQVPASAISTAIENRLQQIQQQQPGQTIPPLQLASIEAGAVSAVVDGSTAMYLARQSGADFSDENVIKVLSDMIDQQMTMQQMQYDMMPAQPGQKKDTFEEFVKKQTGKTLKEFKEEQLNELREALKDPARKDLLMADAARGLLVQKYKEKAAPTDAELKDSYSTYEVKRILLKDDKDKKAADIAATVLAEVKSGKTTFEQAIDRYSKDLPQPNKRLSETTLPLQGSMIQNVDDYKELRGLKAGDVSPVVTTPEGAAIYKVVKVTPNLPKDFEKDKEKLRDQLAEQRAQAMVQKEMDAAAKGDLIKWNSPGYEALYELGRTYSDPELSAEGKRLEALRKVYEKAKKAAADNVAGSREAALVAYVAFDSIYNDPKSDKKKLAPERAEVLTAYLENNESPTVRLELVDLYMEQKDGDSASDQLLLVAQGNNDYEVEGQGNYSQISSKLSKLKSAGLVKPEVEAQIQKELSRWRQEKATYEKEKAADEAEKKKQEAEMQKEVERQMKEEAAKRKEQPKTSKP